MLVKQWTFERNLLTGADVHAILCRMLSLYRTLEEKRVRRSDGGVRSVLTKLLDDARHQIAEGVGESGSDSEPEIIG